MQGGEMIGKGSHWVPIISLDKGSLCLPIKFFQNYFFRKELIFYEPY